MKWDSICISSCPFPLKDPKLLKRSTLTLRPYLPLVALPPHACVVFMSKHHDKIMISYSLIVQKGHLTRVRLVCGGFFTLYIT